MNAVWDETQKVLRPNAFITVIYANKAFNMDGDNKYSSVQFVLNNNAGDIHPIDINRRDKNGNPVIIGVLPLTASLEAREKEFNEYVEKYYNGDIPTHLLSIIRCINMQKNAEKERARKQAMAMQQKMVNRENF